MRRGGGEIPRKTNNIDSGERKKNHLFRFPSSRVFTAAREKKKPGVGVLLLQTRKFGKPTDVQVLL